MMVRLRIRSVCLIFSDQYDAKATFFITAQQPDYFPMIKKVYDEGHTVGLHSYTHEYDQVYASVDAYFDDLEKK